MCREGRLRRTFWTRVWIGLLLMVLQVQLAQGQNSPPRNSTEAWKWMSSLLENAGVKNPAENDGVIRGSLGSSEFAIHLTNVSSVAQVANDPDFPNVSTGVKWYEFPYVSVGPGRLNFRAAPFPGQVYKIASKAQRFQATLLYLVHQAQEEQPTKDAAALEAFKPKALAWQQMAVKPALPEEAQRHQVLAAYAYKNKDISKAIDEYLQALNIYPYWPDGQNNVAYLCAEVGSRRGYQLAAYHMKMYLMLAPNAADAKAAQDSIFIWEDKAKAPAQ